MSRLISKATGNFTTASTWGLVDDTSYLDSEAGNTASTTAFVYSSTFTPGAITIDGIAVKIASRIASASGTMSIELFNNTDNATVATVAVNVSDILNTGSAASAAYNRGWYFFKFSGNQTLIAGKAYKVGFKTSVNGTVNLYRDGTAGNWARLFRTTTAQAPAAGDQLHIIGELTGAGTGNSFVVTMDNTATTSFGPTVSGGPPQGVTIGVRGTLTCGTGATTNYYFRWKGIFFVTDGGTLNIGTSITPVPNGSTAVFEMDSVANVDTGFEFGHGATVNMYGYAKFATAYKTLMTLDRGGYCTTNGTAVTAVTSQAQSFIGLTGAIVINGVSYTILSVTDATHLTLTTTAGVQSNPVVWTHAGTANVLTVGDTTGWAAGDSLCVSSTNRTTTQHEKVIIQSVDSATQVTLTTPLTFSHQGTAPFQASVGNLTRNVVVRGIGTNAPSVTTTLQGYIYAFATTCSVTIRYVEFYYLGSAVTNKRGITTSTTTLLDIRFSSLHDGWITSSMGLLVNSNSLNVTFSNNVSYNLNDAHYTNLPTAGILVLDGNLAMGAINNQILNITDAGTTVTNNIACCGSIYGLAITENSAVLGTNSGNTCHSNGQGGFELLATISGGLVSNCFCWRNAGTGLLFNTGTVRGITFDTGTLIGNSSANMGVGGIPMGITFKNYTCSGDTIFSTGTGFTFGGTGIALENCSFGVASGVRTVHTSADLTANNSSVTIECVCSNCTFGSPTLVSGLTTQINPDYFTGSCIGFQRFNQAAGNHKTYKIAGILSIDTVIFRTASPSQRLTPLIATSRLQSARYKVAVANGSTYTVAVRVRQSVSTDVGGANYNGQFARLYVEKNVAAGIADDTLLATATSASSGAWEALGGTTLAVTDDCILSFYVDCGGSGYTVGWLNVDDWF